MTTTSRSKPSQVSSDKVETGETFLCKNQFGKSSPCVVIQVDKENETAFIHFKDYDQRMDKWVGFSALSPCTETFTSNEDPLEESEPFRLTRSQRRRRSQKQITNHSTVHDPYFSNPRNVEEVIFGNFLLNPWYCAPYPGHFSKEKRLFVCPTCFKYIIKPKTYLNHLRKCPFRRPPGDEIYKDGSLSIFEVDGQTQKLYCQCLSLFCKLFLNHKSLFFDLSAFRFYVICERVSAYERWSSLGLQDIGPGHRPAQTLYGVEPITPPPSSPKKRRRHSLTTTPCSIPDSPTSASALFPSSQSSAASPDSAQPLRRSSRPRTTSTRFSSSIYSAPVTPEHCISYSLMDNPGRGARGALATAGDRAAEASASTPTPHPTPVGGFDLVGDETLRRRLARGEMSAWELIDLEDDWFIPLGFFSKEKFSPDQYNLACILIFPPYQQRGLGYTLMDLSYHISRRENKIGTPERPLSDLGHEGYHKYWFHSILYAMWC